MTFGGAAFILSLIGVVPYLYGIIHGNVRPARMSWFIWSVILALGLWSYVTGGGTDSAWLIIGDLTITAVVFAFALWRGSGGWERLDIACLTVAVAGLLLWQIVGDAWLGVAGALLADAVAMVPTVVKSLRDPYSESASTFIFSAAASACGILAVGGWNLLLLSYPVYLCAANCLAAGTIMVGQYQLRRHGIAGLPDSAA